MNAKLKSPLFWVSMVSIILAAGGVDFEAMTSWKLLGEALLSILDNPVALVACVVAGYGVWMNNDVPLFKKSK